MNTEAWISALIIAYYVSDRAATSVPDMLKNKLHELMEISKCEKKEGRNELRQIDEHGKKSAKRR